MAIHNYRFAKWYQESYDNSEWGGEVLTHISIVRTVLDSNVEAKAKADIVRTEKESLRIGHIQEDGSIRWKNNDCDAIKDE